MQHYLKNLAKRSEDYFQIEGVLFRIGGILAIISTIFILTSCMGVPMSKSIQDITSLPLTTVSTSIQSFRGRFSVQYNDRYRKKHNFHGSFKLQQNNTNSSLELSGLLGQTIAVIYESPNGATLKIPNSEPKNSSNVDKLTQSILGFSLPFSELRFLLLQKASSHSLCKIAKDTDDIPRVQKVKNSDWNSEWKIECIEYIGRLPAANIKRLNIVHITPPFDIKLVFDI
ncbi:MAG: outer membrane lipoprotein LolB [Burkholderia sp.]|nr:outer membrane lipoprotein LolB [Burkholderia sp.]